jgi:hypothetical protein
LAATCGYLWGNGCLQFGREQYLNLISIPLWINTQIMVADIFTKPLDLTTFT